MKKYIPVLAIVIFLLTVVLVIWFDDLVDRVIVQPVAYLIFMAQIVFGSFHQGVLWISFIVIVLLVALMILIPELSPPLRPKDEEWDYPDRIHIWERHIWAMNEGDYLRISLEDHIADLVIDAMSYRDGEQMEVIIKRFRAGDIKLPPEVHQIIMAGYQPSLLDEKTKYQYHPEEIIRFLESQMGGNHPE
jgi:hypothetical protein